MKQVKNSKKINKQQKKVKNQKQQLQKASQPLVDNNICQSEEDQSAIENYEVSFLDPEDEDYDNVCDQGLEIQEYDDHKGAIGHFNIAITIDPNQTYAYYLKSVSLEKLNFLEKALVHVNKALAIDPQDEDSLKLKSEILEKLNYQGKGLKEKAKLSAKILKKGLDFMHKDQFQEAIKQFDELIKINPHTFQAYFEKGNALFYLLDFDQALWCAKKAIDIDPNSDSAYNLQGAALAFQGILRYDYQNRVILIRQSIHFKELQIQTQKIRKRIFIWDVFQIKLKSLIRQTNIWRELLNQILIVLYFIFKKAICNITLGFNLFCQIRYEKSIECYKKALALNPTQDLQEKIIFRKALSLYRINHYEESLKCFENVIQINPTNDEAYFRIGVVLQHLNGFNKSLEYFKKALSLKPDNQEYKDHINYVLERQKLTQKPQIQPKKSKITKGLKQKIKKNSKR